MSQEPALEAFRLLVVCEVAARRRELRDHFEATGCQVEEARDGFQALERLAGARPGQRPDLVVVDVHLPLIDGFELADRVGRTPGYEDAKVLLFTDRREEVLFQEGPRAMDFARLKTALDYSRVPVAVESHLRSLRIRRRLEWAQAMVLGLTA